MKAFYQVNPMYTTEVNALISLIEDPDEAIYLQVRNELKGYGEQILPQLEYYWELNDFGQLFQNRLEELISSIQYESIYKRLKEWKASEDQDLLEGALIVNRYGYPGCDEEEIKRKISKIRQDIWLELNDNLTAVEVVRVFNHMLFNEHGFTGDRDHYDQPQNSYISDLISNKRGNPLSLSVLYAYIANSLDIPIYGVNLPSHFILCYLDYDAEMKAWGVEEEDANILFYINPFSEGSMLMKEEIDEFLNNQSLPIKEMFYRPCSNVDIVSRMLNNLIHSYIGLNDQEKVRELRTLQSILLEKED